MKTLNFTFSIVVACCTFIAATSVSANSKLSDLPKREGQRHEQGLVKRIAVFPFKVQKRYSEDAEKSWWSVREEMSRSKRFLLASRLFLQKKEVFQARDELEPVDAIVLGKLLEAHALITGFVVDQTLKIFVYSGKNGSVLWTSSMFLDPDIPLPVQLGKKSIQLIQAFMAELPFQAYQVPASEMGAQLQVEGDVRIAHIDIGVNHNIEPGQSVQWVRLLRKSLKPTFQGGADYEVFATGKILSVEGRIAKVEVQKFSRVSELRTHSLVRIPAEAERLQKIYGLSRKPLDQLIQQSHHLVSKKKKQPEQKPLVSALKFIGSLALVLVLAL